MGMGTVPLVKPTKGRIIEAFANQVADILYLYPNREFMPVNVAHLLEVDAYRAFKLDFAVVDLDPMIEGITLPGDPPRLMLSSTVYDRLVDEANGRDRFTGAHELGHCLMHAHQLTSEYQSLAPKAQKLYRRADIPAYVDPEWQANKFAAFLLMPAWAIHAAVQQFGPNSALLADRFQMSQQAMRIRLGELGYPS